MERKGEASRHLKVFEQSVFKKLAKVSRKAVVSHQLQKAAVGNVLGSIMRTTMEANQKS